MALLENSLHYLINGNTVLKCLPLTAEMQHVTIMFKPTLLFEISWAL